MNGSMSNGVAAHQPAELDGVSWLTPHDEGYAEKRQINSKDDEVTPSAIASPQTAEDVSKLVRYAVSHNVPFTVRTGGHDGQGRSIASKTLCIDMRNLDHVTVAEDRKTATFGGGVLGRKVASELGDRMLVTPCPAIESVGYVGWSTMGGWGPFLDHFGFGADQIVGAMIVDCKGDIVRADSSTLKGIRGGGGNFGVIVEVTVKTYELDKLFAGLVILDSSNGIDATFQRLVTGLQQLHEKGDIPSAAGIEPFVSWIPGLGPSVFTLFVWSSPDVQAGQDCLERVQSIAPVAKTTVSRTTVADWQATSSKSAPYGQWGRPLAVNISSWSQGVLEVMSKIIADMPVEQGAKIQVQSLSSKSKSVKDPTFKNASCMSPDLRQPHFLVEMIGSTLDGSNRDEVVQWAERSYDALRNCDEAMSCTHPALLHTKHQNPETFFGTEMEFVKRLKESCDPMGVFSYALPRIY